jgi:hypothetical protein
VDQDHNEERIELVLQADKRLVRVARLVASGVATTAGFDVEEVEDLQIAVDELWTALVEGGDGGPLLLGFELGDGEVSITGELNEGEQQVLRLQFGRGGGGADAAGVREPRRPLPTAGAGNVQIDLNPDN